MAEHECKVPGATGEQAIDMAEWTCPDCGQAYFAIHDTCGECHQPVGGPKFVPFGDGDGQFPLVSTSAGLIDYFRKEKRHGD